MVPVLESESTWGSYLILSWACFAKEPGRYTVAPLGMGERGNIHYYLSLEFVRSDLDRARLAYEEPFFSFVKFSWVTPSPRWLFTCWASDAISEVRRLQRGHSRAWGSPGSFPGVVSG